MDPTGPLLKEIHPQSAAVLKALVRGFKLPAIDTNFREIDLTERLEKPNLYYVEEALTSILDEEPGVALYTFGLKLEEFDANKHWFVLTWRQYSGVDDGPADMAIESIDLRVERAVDGETHVEMLQSYQGSDTGEVILSFHDHLLTLTPSDYMERLLDGVNYLDRIPNLPIKMAKPIALFLAGLRFVEGQVVDTVDG
ncbi:hypothetical protein D3C71_77090 [compost metagenome]